MTFYCPYRPPFADPLIRQWGRLGCFHLLAVVNNAPITWIYNYLFTILLSFLSGIYNQSGITRSHGNSFFSFWGSTVLFPLLLFILLALTWKAHSSYTCPIYMVSHIRETFRHVYEINCFCLNPFILLMLANILVHRKFQPSAWQNVYIILLVKYEAGFQSRCVNYRYGFNYMI